VIVYLPPDSFEHRFETSSIVPPGWIATKKVSSREPDPSEPPPQAARPVAARTAAARQIEDRAAQLDFNGVPLFRTFPKVQGEAAREGSCLNASGRHMDKCSLGRLGVGATKLNFLSESRIG